MIYTSNVIFYPLPNFLDSFVPRPEIESFGWKELEFELTQELRISKRLNERRLSPQSFRADVSLNGSKHREKAINKIKLTQSAGPDILFFPHKDTNNSCFVQKFQIGFHISAIK